MSIERDKSTIVGMLQLGCDRAAAVLIVGWSEEQLRQELKFDPGFAQDMAQAEGQAELHHMRVVHSATKDEKYWRAAAWWLGRRSANRLARSSSYKLTSGEIKRFLEGLVDMIFRGVRDEADRDRVIASLLAAANETDPQNMALLLEKSGLEVPKFKDEETIA